VRPTEKSINCSKWEKNVWENKERKKEREGRKEKKY
jgi:hypothetical protein